MSNEIPTESIAQRVSNHWRRGELVYPSDADGSAFWPPNDYVPGTGEVAQWRVSAGYGEVYASTTQYERDGTRRFLALIDLDEGFRMLGQLVEVAPGDIIGTRVRARFTSPEDDDSAPHPLFSPVEAGIAL